MPPPRFITDPASACYPCKGLGGHYEDDGLGRKMFIRCHYCGGSKVASVRVG